MKTWPNCEPPLGGGAVTVTVAVPLLPSLVAVIVVLPAATAATRPVPLTDATAPLAVVQTMARPLRVLPAASLGVAVSCTDCPAGTEALAGLTTTDATGTVATVILAVPLFPSEVAVIVAEPAAWPLTMPVELTVAMVALLVDQVMLRPVSTVPAESLVVAPSCAVEPTATVGALGETVTLATGAGEG